MRKIAKKLKNWEECVAKETERTRQARIDELSLHQERNPTAESIDDSNSGFTEQSTFL